MAAIVVDGLWSGFRPKSRMGWRGHDVRWALRDISFTVEPGAMLGVVGDNGSGKSTLLHCLSGVYHPQRGSVSVACPVSSLVELSAGFNRELTGRENIMIASSLIGMSRAELAERYEDIIAFAGLDPTVLDAPLRTYSAGMALRLGFSVTVHVDPRVLLVDEVLAVGDEAFQHRCLEYVAKLRASGCAVVLVSHDLDLIENQCDRVALLETGELSHLGDPADVVERYQVSTRTIAEDTRGALWRDSTRRPRRRRP